MTSRAKGNRFLTRQEVKIAIMEAVKIANRPDISPEHYCRVYWGSHGCSLARGHEGEHVCDCSIAPDGSLLPHMNDAPGSGNVGRAPYYGPDTRFYGEDAPTAASQGAE